MLGTSLAGASSMNTVRVSLAERSYDIVITNGDIGGIGPFAAARTRGRRALLITDSHLAADRPAVSHSLEQAGFMTESAVLPAGEAQKCLGVASSLYDRLVDLRADRKTLVV